MRNAVCVCAPRLKLRQRGKHGTEDATGRQCTGRRRSQGEEKENMESPSRMEWVGEMQRWNRMGVKWRNARVEVGVRCSGLD